MANKTDDYIDFDEKNDESLKNYNIFILYKDITNIFKSLSLNNNDAKSNFKAYERLLNKGNYNNLIFDDSHRPFKRKNDWICGEIGINCTHIKQDFVKVKK